METTRAKLRQYGAAKVLEAVVKLIATDSEFLEVVQTKLLPQVELEDKNPENRRGWLIGLRDDPARAAKPADSNQTPALAPPLSINLDTQEDLASSAPAATSPTGKDSSQPENSSPLQESTGITIILPPTSTPSPREKKNEAFHESPTVARVKANTFRKRKNSISSGYKLENLEFILCEPILCNGFRKFLQKKLCEENLLFWKDVERFKEEYDPMNPIANYKYVLLIIDLSYSCSFSNVMFFLYPLELPRNSENCTSRALAS